MPPALLQITNDTLRYWRAFAYYARGGAFAGSHEKFFDGDRRQACHVFGAALAIRMWHRPHYRTTSYAADLRANLSNVAVPGTGMALLELRPGIERNQRRRQSRRQHGEEPIRHTWTEGMVHQHSITPVRQGKR